MPPVMPVLKAFSPVLVEPAMPSTPELRAVAEDVLAAFRYAFTVAAAHDVAQAVGDVDKPMSEFLKSRSASSRGRYRQIATALLASPAPIRAMHFGRYAAVEPKEYLTLGSEKVRSQVVPLQVEPTAVRPSLRALGHRLARVDEIAPHLLINQKVLAAAGQNIKIKLDPDLVAGLAFKKMRLFIKSVTCLEETSGVFEGSDEINMGGTVTDPFGNTSQVGEFVVSSDFDEGEVVNFGTSKTFAAWNLATASTGFPYVYGAVIALGEKDDGGFWKFLQELWAKIEEKVTELVSTLALAAIGAAIGAEFAGIGAIVGAVVGALIGWLISAFDNGDDIIGAKPVLMTLASCRRSYYDWAKLTTPEGWTTTLHFKGSGGRYDVNVGYRVFTQ
jgi:hypothetical protein